MLSDRDTTLTGPYATAARLYRAAGWPGVLPIGNGPNEKWPPPRNATGHGAPEPSGPDIEAWIETHGDRNIGLRAPVGVLGLDVDAYEKGGKSKGGGEALAALVAQYGPLPPTWISGARPAPSGIYWFRVPTHLDGREVNWPGEAAKGIELIQHGHRYGVVWPSTNPEADGARYEWRFDHGELRPDHATFVPRPSDLPDLPEAWMRGLALSYERTEKSDLGSAELAAWWAALRPGPPCPRVREQYRKAVAELNEGASGRHETARGAARTLAAYGGEGHAGAGAALTDLGEQFIGIVSGPGRDADGEWGRLLSGAVALAVTGNDPPRQLCACDPPKLPMPKLPDGYEVPPPGPKAAGRPDTPAVPAPDLDEFVAELLTLGDSERLDRARRVVPSLVDIDPIEQQAWKSQLKQFAKLPAGSFDQIVKAIRDARKAEQDQLAEQERLARVEAAREFTMPGPHDPLAAAEYLAAHRVPHTDGEPHIRWWRGDFYTWQQTHWRPWRPEAVDNWLYAHTRSAVYLDEDGDTAPWRPSERRIDSVAHALGRSALYRDSYAEPADSPDAIACSNGVLGAGRTLMPHGPGRFNLYALPFAYAHDAVCPQWLAFLQQVLPGDEGAHRFLQEWFGYVISGRTDLQKMASLFGPKRCGKGTIARVLEALLGAEAVASPTLERLATQFGEAPLVGKRLAVLSDVRWNARATAEAVPVLLAISGEDTRNVPRKNRDDWHGKLGVRFMAMGNDAPTFSDASGALAGRMVHIEFTQSFFGREDPGLTGRLYGELPGILNWALDGLDRLATRGRFLAPESSSDAEELVSRISSPVRAFVDDRCIEAGSVSLDDLYAGFRGWCEDEGRVRSMTKDVFSRELRTISNGSVTIERRRDPITGARSRIVNGLTLAPSAVPRPASWPGSVPGLVPPRFTA